jgi:hypothetical protein
MEHTTKHRFPRGVRLVVGATALATLVATVAGSAIAAVPESQPAAKSSAAEAVNATLTEGYVNEWAAGDAAVARYLEQQAEAQQAASQPVAARAQLLPDLVDPSVRRQLACSFAAGSFGIAPELEVGAGTCDAAR